MLQASLDRFPQVFHPSTLCCLILNGGGGRIWTDETSWLQHIIKKWQQYSGQVDLQYLHLGRIATLISYKQFIFSLALYFSNIVIGGSIAILVGQFLFSGIVAFHQHFFCISTVVS